jgi:CubicO group peptidase (beta-lactamase class C family)
MINRRQFMLASAVASLCGLPALGFARDRFEHAIARLRGFVEDDKLPFASIRIAQHGDILAEAHIAGREKIGPDSLYRVYSMTKPVVAAAVVMLVGDGKLDLQDPVSKYVPELAELQVVAGALDHLEPARPMTVAHLLTHTCGFANSWGNAKVAPLYRKAGLIAGKWMYDPEIGGLDGFVGRLATLPLEFQPGSDWMYGYGLDVAGLIVQRISGERLGEFLERRLFKPLGMEATGFRVREGHEESLAGLYVARADGMAQVVDGSEKAPLKKPFADGGSAGLVSTLEDYGRFADMLANGGRRGSVRVMDPAMVRTLTSPYGPQQALLPSLLRFGHYEPGSIGHALGGVVRLDNRSGAGSRGEYAWGGAAGTGFWATPGLGLSVTVMTQLMPVTALPARDLLRPLVYEALAS